MPVEQLPLAIALPQSATLAGFVGASNDSARLAAQAIVDGRSRALFVHGPAASGKTHLLQAVCRALGDARKRAVYLPLGRLDADPAAIMAGLESMDCVCIDDVGRLAGDRDDEIALVGLIDALRRSNARLVAADRLPPSELGLLLPDLASRLSWGGAVATHPPSDADRGEILITRAAGIGLELPASTAAWLLRHSARELPALLATLDRLDHASLAEKRRLTIPFVKSVLADD